MNTPAHLIFGATAFGRAKNTPVTLAAVLGALLPDLSLYLMVCWSIWIMGIPAQVVFDEMYFSDAWQSVFAVDNSVPLWGLALALGIWQRWPVLIAFAGAGLLHLAFDFSLHNDDARAHFWPITDWVFHSPVSYWDPDHYGNFIAPIEVFICAAMGVVLWRRHESLRARVLIGLGLSMELAPFVMFQLMFSD